MIFNIIFNPTAGRGRAARLKDKLFEAARELPGDVRYHQTRADLNAMTIANDLKTSGEIVIVAGGDGTINEVVNGLVGGNCMLGIIPMGGGNDLARSLKIPSNIRESLRIIKAGNHSPIDLAKINDRYFMNQAGIGFDADSVISTHGIKYIRGFPLYFLALLKTLTRYRNRKIHFQSGDISFERETFMAIFGNGQFAGGGFHLAPGADLQDGFLEVYVFDALSILEIFRHLPKAIRGKHRNLKQVQYFKVKQLEIDCPEGCPVQCDGEVLDVAKRKITVSVGADKIEVLLPQNWKQ